MTDGFTTGLHHALWALGYLLGLAPVAILAALLVVLALTTGPRITHQVRVHRIRRQTRRTGRAQ
jgi:hypothetical protein